MADEGISDRPWTVTRIPAMVKVWEDTVGEALVCVPSRGLFVAAIVAIGDGEAARDGQW